MPRLRQFGDPLAVASVTKGLSRAIPTTRVSVPPIEWRKFCINGYPASAQFQNLLHESTNQAVLHRGRQLFWAPGMVPGSSSSSSVTRWRFAFRTSEYHHALNAIVSMQPPSLNPAPNSYTTLSIYSDATETTLVASKDFYYGMSGFSPGSTKTGWKYARTFNYQIGGLAASTDYYAVFTDNAGARTLTASVTELQSMGSIGGHLPQTLNHDSEVLALYRQKVAAIQKSLWKNCGATLFNWTANNAQSAAYGTTGSVIRASSATAVNIFDRVTTTISSSTPGVYLDTRYMGRRSQSTIPCVMKVYGYLSGSTTGTFYLKNSAGTTITSINTFTSTPGWKSVTFDMPIALDKYDLMAASTGGGYTVFAAASLYPYEP